MASQAKSKKAGWGSLLSGAVAGLESKLDTILAEDSEASIRSRAAEKAMQDAKGSIVVPRGLNVPSGRGNGATSRDVSRTRVNDRLAKRLADATATKTPSQPGSQVPSRVASPTIALESARTSAELTRGSGETLRSIPEVLKPAVDATKPTTEEKPAATGKDQLKSMPEPPSTLLSSDLPINPARQSIDSAASRSSIDNAISTPNSPSLANATNQEAKKAVEYETEIAQMREDYLQAERQRQEEMHANLERIDALQAKLKYLAEQTVAAAKEANGSASPGSAEQRIAEKDQQIAQLMEEGEKLSKMELRQLGTIKKLRAKATEDERAATDIKKKVVHAELAERDLKARLQRADVAERQANEKIRQIASIEKHVEALSEDRESASELIHSLTVQLSEAEGKFQAAERQANANNSLQADQDTIASLQNELEDAQIEKKLAEDRAAAEMGRIAEAAEREKQRLQVSEMELRKEVQRLESKSEALRAVAEENTSDNTGEGHAKLLRQVETLQNQYALAAGNWQAIEGSLYARVSALEKERDEANEREAVVRNRARDVGIKARRTEDDLESASEQATTLRQELTSQQKWVKGLQEKLETTTQALSEAKADFDRQRRLWDAELSQRLEEEKARWHFSGSIGHSTAGLRTESPVVFQHKVPAGDTGTVHGRRTSNRLTLKDLAALHADRPASRRSSALPTPGPASARARATPYKEASPSISREHSTISLDIPPTPSIEADDAFEGSSSPHRTINDMVSASTLATGPSVQLVERLSAAVRRLESEKAASKDELARLSSQRDEARNEVVSLMREVEESRGDVKKVGELEKEVIEVKRRYEASLEMLGEREEVVQELKADVADLKRIYRELVEEKVK